MAFKFQKALVTGGAGFIGSHLVEALVAEGRRVTVIDNLSTGRLSNLATVQNKIAFYRGDIRNPQHLKKAISGCEIVFHLAAVVSVPQTVEDPVDSAAVNEMGTLLVLEAVRRHHVKKFVGTSSCAVYGDGIQNPKMENMTPEPQSPYAVQKLTGEYYARLYHELYGIDTISLRYFNVYGPRQDPSSPYSGVISIFMTKAVSKTQPVIYGNGNQYRDFIFVKDVITANLLAAAAEQSNGQCFNIGTGVFVRINQLWETIQGLAGSEQTPAYAPARPGEITASVADIGLARSIIGFKPAFTFEKGLELTLEWYRHIA